MSLTSLLRHNVVISRAPKARDDYGNASGPFVDDVTTTRGFVQVGQDAIAPDSAGVDTVIVDAICYFEPDVEIAEGDAVKFESKTYFVRGVQPYHSPQGVHHVKVLLSEAK